ncbi:MAG: YlxM family DNA-binding protein [Lachnospiraceae bacterium]|nr:YlxM family DNA-binding protein [Lachnospiraceae bacterium]
MEKIVRQSLLYDFYGELLTDHQKNIYEEVVMNDMSYSEIGRIYGISRQGAYDLIKRCDKILEDYEAKLKLVEKFVNAREKIATMKSNIIKLKSDNKDSELEKLIEEIDIETAKLLEEF